MNFKNWKEKKKQKLYYGCVYNKYMQGRELIFFLIILNIFSSFN